MNAFLTGVAVMIVVSIAAAYGLERVDMSAQNVFATDNVRL